MLQTEFLELPKRQRYLVGVSGGRDSVALLHALLENGYRNLVVCHLNHGLRGRASGQDAAFVRRLAGKLGLACEVGKADVARRMEETGESMELAARNARREFFRDCVQRHRCRRVLLAHHADDQVETVLFNLLRGSAGLRGMRFSSAHQINGVEIEFLRPLLAVPRREIDAFLTKNKIPFREDATNAEAVGARNRLRNEAIPLLEEIAGREIGPAVLRACELSAARDEALTGMLTSLNLTDPQGRLFLPKLRPLPAALQAESVHHFLKDQGVSNISHALLARCIRLIDDPESAKVNLPGGKHFRRKEKRLFVS